MRSTSLSTAISCGYSVIATLIAMPGTNSMLGIAEPERTLANDKAPDDLRITRTAAQKKHWTY
jgi:hypothetical protein